MCCVACSDDDENIDKSPIKGLEIPPSTTPVKPGAPVTIKGEGFTIASEIWFRAVATRAEGGGDVKATVTNVSATEITFTTPMVFGNQSVLLKENGKEYELGEMTFEGQSEDVVILPKRISKIVEIEGGNASYADTTLYSYNADGKIISKKSNQRGFTRFQHESNRIVKTGDHETGSFELKDGKADVIKLSSVYSDGREEYALSYNTAGYLETVKCKYFDGDGLSEGTETFEYTNGCITKYTYGEKDYRVENIFEYGDFKHINNVNIDLNGIVGDYNIYEAFVLGVIGNRCKYLPTKMKMSETGEGDDGKITTDTYEYTYECVMNAEGYVTKITVKEGSEIDWIYEIYYEQ